MRRTLALHLATSQLLNSSTPQLSDFLTLSFVFTYILGLFPRFLYTQDKRINGPLLWGEGGESSEPGEGWVNARDCA